MLRKVIAVMAGLFTAVALVALIESISHRIYPPPPGIDFRDPEQLASFINGLPLSALLWVLGAWVLGTLAGAWLACWIARDRTWLIAAIIGAVMLTATALNLAAIPHPTWFSVSAVIGVAAAALAGGRIAAVTGIRLRSL
ncbi:hypothetical protein [Elongatibacter sediminis]|uniref:Uncharacterized protein n=1 Tax=Elongatibacter sediminis TaxID=3119006 RepID=A0AAW9RML7_9GAMM